MKSQFDLAKLKITRLWLMLPLQEGQGYEPEQKVSVHAATLRLTLEDFHTRGGKIPPELFNTFEKNQTQIKNKPKQ